MKHGMLFLLLSLLFLASCTSPCCYNYCIEGASEFVLDSYKIKEGKFAILSLEGEEFCPFPCSYLDEYVDCIDEDDILSIAVFHPSRKDLSEAVAMINDTVGYRVINGKIHLPSLPPISIIDLTLEQARNKLQSFYNEQLANTEVFIEYKERLHSKVELTGNVATPEIPINGRIRLYEVLSIAGIPNNANLFKSYVLREGCILPIDLYKLVHEGDMSQNIVMRPRDKIFIADPNEATVMVMGEVGVPLLLPIPKGSISLREALAAAGGIPFTGDKRCILVIRGNSICPKIYKLSWNHITYLPNDSLLLMPGDTVYISENPITKWNRFIDQLLPSSLLFDVGVRAKGVFN